MQNKNEIINRAIKLAIPLLSSTVTMFLVFNRVFLRDIVIEGSMELIIMLMASFITLAFFYSNIVLLQKHPTSITLSLIGFPGVGKTVFLTVLFDYLQREKDRQIRFAPYGQDTHEIVQSNLNQLSSGHFLSRTPMGEIIFYRAFATLQRMLYRKKYKLEIADFAGENMQEFDPASEYWLHKGDYFSYAVQSNGIILALDCAQLIKTVQSPKEFHAQTEKIINSYIVAFQILVEKKGAIENKRLKEPVSLLFLKSDLLEGDTKLEELVLNRAARIIEVCKNRCLFFQCFFVSSIGYHYFQDMTIEPVNISKPIKWMLTNINEK
jgi:GTPase SAR1 family protein